jgi:hypothetical protein
MKQVVLKTVAVACVIAATSCSANSQFAAPGRSGHPTASHVVRLPENLRHGAEIESGSTIIVSEGNYHAAFPAGAKLVRTADGIVITYKGVTRTFSSTARVDVGSYHRYAKAPAE